MVKRLQLVFPKPGTEERDFAEEGQKMMTEHSHPLQVARTSLVFQQPLAGIVLIQSVYISFAK